MNVKAQNLDVGVSNSAFVSSGLGFLSNFPQIEGAIQTPTVISGSIRILAQVGALRYILDKANGIRVYTNKVRLHGLGKIEKIETRVGGFCLYSCGFNRQANFV